MSKLAAALLLGGLVGSFAVVNAQVLNRSTAPRRNLKRQPISRAQFNKAQAQQNLTVVIHDAAVKLEEAQRYKGFDVKPHPKAEGVELALQQQVGAALSRLDSVPADRVDQFRWMMTDAGLKITGWAGSILRTAVRPDGVVVEVEVRPRHDGNVGFRTSDYAVETYLFTESGISHLASRRGEAYGGVKTFN